jgi:general secretion pathway protein I
MIKHRRAGFTLIEMLIALAILAITFGFAFRAFSGGIYWLDRDGTEQRAILLARSQLARIGHDIPLVDGETDGRAADGLAWKIAISPYGSAVGGLLGHQVAVRVGWRDGREERQIQLQTLRLGPADGDR